MRQQILRADLFCCKNVGTGAQMTKMIAEIQELKSKNPATAYTNPGCWRGNAWPDIDILWLKDAISNLSTEAIEFYEIKPAGNFIINYWANVNEPQSRNVVHNHNNAIFSGTYYLQAEGTGDLRFSNPANLIGCCNPDSPFTHDFSFTPNDGDLVLWPSWMPHEVETNFSNKQRINIAFDIRYKNDKLV
jgi:hypothetical protein